MLRHLKICRASRSLAKTGDGKRCYSDGRCIRDVSYICIGRESEGGGLQIGSEWNPSGSLFLFFLQLTSKDRFLLIWESKLRYFRSQIHENRLKNRGGKTCRVLDRFLVIFSTLKLEKLVFRLDESTIFTKSRFSISTQKSLKNIQKMTPKFVENRVENMYENTHRFFIDVFMIFR